MAQRYCTNCGAELREDDRFCPSCGHPTAVAKAPTPGPSVQSPPPRQPGRWSAGRVLFLVFVAHRYGTLRYSSVEEEDGIECGLRMISSSR
jgi:hypothetical protein